VTTDASASCTVHYEQHLAPVYAWMAGGPAAAIARGDAELEALGVARVGRGGDEPAARALDLGAGFGAHAIPLARRGFAVTAIDESAHLLAELSERAGELPIRTLQADLVEALADDPGEVDLLLCLGDTLPHLATLDRVRRLCALASERVRPGGRVVFSFRDYTRPAEGERAFVCVRGDAERIASCVLEIERDSVRVHDLLHEREAEGGWSLQASSYTKLRLAPGLVEEALGAGWEVERGSTASGMVALAARRR